MAIGYNTQIPPIATVTFYNAIANNGCMVRPRIVTALSKNGEIVEKFPVEVIKDHICSDTALHTIQEILKDVVNGHRGTGRRVKSKYFYVSGKTGTAQVADEHGGYHS
jgi:cell division protein FtsI (penicillin-binding protein 3)